MIEIEVKIKIERTDLERIARMGCIPQISLQKNCIYALGEGFLRVRKENGKTYLTHKGVRQEGEYNSRAEKEVCLNEDKFEELKDCLEFLGKGFCYKKERANFELNNCIVSLDFLSNKEMYVEIEGNEEGITKNLEILGLSNHKIETRNYQEILQSKE
jgi:predicted adenylyl cyclase CyaB